MIAALGLLAGALPLLLVNLYYFDRSGSWLSLAGVGQGTERSLQGFATFAFEYASLAAGRRAAELVLGLPIARAAETAEVAFAGLALLGVLGTALWRRAPAPLRGAGVVAGGYVAVGVALYGLPRPTDMHHRILGTPFLYLALGLAVSALWGAGPSASVARRAAVALALLGGVWLAARLPRLVAVEGALIEGRASGRFNPSLSALGRFASRQADEAVFIASDWGVATQIYCFANGRPGLVHELYWVYRDFDQIRRLMRGRGTLYLVRCEPPPRVNPEATARIESDVAGSPDWIEVPAESEVATLPGVRVRKYVLRSGGGP
jgi:hypothetical protein